MNKRPRLADVAARAGVSATAVSLVLNNRPSARMSADAVARIKQAAEELGYRPNPAARSLRMGRTQTIGFLSDEITVTRYGTEMIHGVLDEAHAAGFQVLISEVGSGDPAPRSAAVATMLDRRPEGIIFGLVRARQIDLPDELATVPHVLVNATTEGDSTSVLPEEFEAGRAVAGALLEAGHRRIAVIGDSGVTSIDPRVSCTIGDRFRGIADALDAAGVTDVERVPAGPWEPEAGFRALHHLADTGAPPTGVICLNDRLAFGVYEACHQRGLRIPEDLSIVSFDDDVLASYVHPGLTTARIPYLDMGRLALQLLLAGDVSSGVRRLPMPLQRRGSVSIPRMPL